MKKRTRMAQVAIYGLCVASLFLSGCGKHSFSSDGKDSFSSDGKHSFSSKWTYDEASHWHACIDAGYEDLKSNVEPHNFDATVIEPTFESGGYTIYSCLVCGFSYRDDEKDALPITITWENYDGTVLEVDSNVPYGTIPTYDSAIPTRQSDEQYSYSFSGWSPKIDRATRSTTYVAQYSASEVLFEFCKYENGYAVTNYFGDNTSVVIPDEYNGKPVLAIGTYGTSYNSSFIPNGFYGNTNIESVVLPSKLKRINPYAFSSCTSLEAIDSSKTDKSFEIGSYAFANTKSLLEFTIESENKSVGHNAFHGSGIRKAIINRNLSIRTATDQSADINIFSSCANLTEIILNGNEYAFTSTLHLADDCPSLKSIKFTNPKCIIEGPIFNGITSLEEIILPMLDRPIWTYFGEGSYKSMSLDLISSDTNLPVVENCKIVETEVAIPGGQFGNVIVGSLVIPKTWAINDYWFIDNDGVWWFLASDDYNFSYWLYDYYAGSKIIAIEYPTKVSSYYFFKMPKDLVIKTLEGDISSDSPYLLNTGYSAAG